jgi:hypothetical protein
VNRFIRVRIVRLCRSTCEVHVVRSSLSFIPNIPLGLCGLAKDFFSVR